jgi:hypothetical protein
MSAGSLGDKKKYGWRWKLKIGTLCTVFLKACLHEKCFFSYVCTRTAGN